MNPVILGIACFVWALVIVALTGWAYEVRR